MYAGRKAMPRANKLTYNRMVEADQKRHRDRLKSVKPSIDMGAPKKHNHLRKNMKREQMMEERFAQIERDNKILLEKMSSIMQKSWLDNDGESLPKPRSLMKVHRKQELQRITKENEEILRRIQQREPTYNLDAWNQDHKVNEQYLKNICEYNSGAGMKRRGVSRGGKRPGSRASVSR